MSSLPCCLNPCLPYNTDSKKDRQEARGWHGKSGPIVQGLWPLTGKVQDRPESISQRQERTWGGRAHGLAVHWSCTLSARQVWPALGPWLTHAMEPTGRVGDLSGYQWWGSLLPCPPRMSSLDGRRLPGGNLAKWEQHPRPHLQLETKGQWRNSILSAPCV